MRDGRASSHVGWPAGRFYWAVLDEVTVRGSRRRERALSYLFEDLLPVRIEDVQSVYRRLGDGRVLACGVERALAAAVRDAGAVSLAPREVPADLESGLALDGAALNLLVGPLAPIAVRRRRAWCGRSVVGAAVICLIGLLIGLERRTAALQAQAAEAGEAAHRLCGLVLDPASGPARVPEPVRLEALARRLRQTRQSPPPDGPTGDVAASLAALLAQWPDAAGATGSRGSAGRVETESIVVTPTVMTVRARVASPAAAQVLFESLRAVPGWRASAPELGTTGEVAALTVRLDRAREESE